MPSIWTDGKTAGTLAPFTAPETDACILNQRIDDLHLTDRRMTHAVFVGVGLKKATLRGIDFSHSTFVRCYFRDAELRGCNFTGCRFDECDFPNSTLINCTLAYSLWKDTAIEPRQILSNLPEQWPNVAHKLLDSLRTNAVAQGDGPAARKYLLAAMRFSREHYHRIAFSSASYYRDKYKGVRRASGFLRWLFSVVERWVWGYGENPALLFGWAAILVFLFAIYYGISAPSAFGFGSRPLLTAAGLAMRYSALTFATNTPADMVHRDLDHIGAAVVVESLCGVIFTGVLAAVVYRRISIRRG
jgi:Pentapeptide repeats (9 copies)